MTNISLDQTRKIARISALSISDNELSGLAKQLDETISYIRHLDTIPTDKIKPIYQTNRQENVCRADKVELSLTQAKALKNTKITQNGYIKVPQILNK